MDRTASAVCDDPLGDLVTFVYAELKRLAAGQLGRNQHVTLRTTELVHEVYLRMARNAKVRWTDRAHFLAIAARCMRQILVDHARARMARKRGSGVQPVEMSEFVSGIPTSNPRAILALDDALAALALIEPRRSQAVELHYFTGLGIEELAQVLKISVRTVRRELRMAEAWLTRELSRSGP